MSTILTNNEIDAAWEGPTPSGYGKSRYDIARAVIAAYEAKLAQQEPVAWIANDSGYNYVQWASNKNWPVGTKFYTHPAPQQADRPRVPEGYVLVPVEPTDEMVDAACDKSDFFRVDFVLAWDAAVNASPELTQSATSHTHKVVPVTPTKEMLISGARAPVELLSPDGALQVYRAMLAAAPEAPAHRLQSDPIFQQAVEFTANRAPEAPAQAEQAAEPVRDEREPSPTAGMSLAQRILHVGGRNNAAGYVEFGSTQAVEALVRHVLRDLPDAPPAQASAVDEREAFEAWLGIKPCGAAHEFGWTAWQARAALAQKGAA